MSGNFASPVGRMRRERVRKGTRSCWECKRKKIRCIYASEESPICTGCLRRGTRCISQEYVDDQSPSNVGSLALGQRMGRVEMLLEKLMEKEANIAGEEHNTAGHVDTLTPSATPPTSYDSLLDNALRKQNEGDMEMPRPTSMLCSSTPQVMEKLRQPLIAMLPCQEDIDYLVDVNQGWWLIQRHIMPHLLRVEPSASECMENPFDSSNVKTDHPVIIARLLLCVAICIQQLPPNIDLQRLHTKEPLKELMEKIIVTVTISIISDDELIGSMEGIECLLLQGIFQVNAGNLRRSWLAYRRAINVSQLMGLHRATLRTSQEIPNETEARRHYMWYEVLRGERYLSLILGVPSATGSAPYPFDDFAPWLSPEDFYDRQLCDISGLILARNQGDAVHAFSATQEIDEKLEALAKRMPQTWWDIPSIAEGNKFVDIASGASQFERIMCHIWHYEIETLVHLPFMLRAATDRRYEYSRISCLRASRGLIKRWKFVTEIHSMKFASNLVEFQAFTAAITLLLGLLGPPHTSFSQDALKEREDDLQLVEAVLRRMESMKESLPHAGPSASDSCDENIAAIVSLKDLIRSGGSLSSNLRLTIEHFGTITITRAGTVHSHEGERILGANPRGELVHIGPCPQISDGQTYQDPLMAYTGSVSAPLSNARGQEYQGIASGSQASDPGSMYMNNATVQFTSSQFPAFEAQTADAVDHSLEWPFQETDIMLFNSFFNADVAGNWVA